MGDVYRSRDTRLGRDVAVKVQRDAATGDTDRLRRFEQEARAASLLNHPNVIAIYDIGNHQGRPYVVTELLEGTTLRDALKHGPQSVERAIEWGIQMVRGLAAAHHRGIVHRDVKPENIFVTREGMIKLLDFGIAKLKKQEGPLLADGGEQQTGTQPGAVMGSVGYMSPEQARGQETDHRSDIFAAGGVLYEMLAGRRAFGGNSPADTVSAILNLEPPPFDASAAVPPGLQRVIRHCLEKDPDRRFQSADDLLFALESVERQPPATVPLPPSDARATTMSLLERAAWTLLVIAATAAVVLAVNQIRAARGVAAPETIRIAGGSATGVYSAVARGLVQVWDAKLTNVIGQELATEGSFHNLRLIDDGQAELAIAQNDIAFHAVKTTRALGHRSTRICGLAALYEEAAHIVVGSRSGISRLEEMKGHRVNLGLKESGARFSSSILLQHFGVDERDLTPDWQDYGAAAPDVAAGSLDVAIAWRAFPVPVLPDLYRAGTVRLLPLDPALIQGLRANQPFWTPITIPAGVYPGQQEPVTTIGVKALLVGSCALSPEVVERLLASLFDNVPDLIAHHQRAAEISLKTASKLEDGMSIDLHPGAERFYKARLR